MAKTVVTVCDECERVGEPTRTYTITRGTDRLQTDLCAEHGEDLELCIEKILKRKASTPPAKRVPGKSGDGGRGRAPVKVTSLDEIEKLKKK